MPESTDNLGHEEGVVSSKGRNFTGHIAGL